MELESAARQIPHHLPQYSVPARRGGRQHGRYLPPISFRRKIASPTLSVGLLCPFSSGARDDLEFVP